MKHFILCNFWVVISLFLANSLEAQVLNAGSDTAICTGQSFQLGGSPTVTGGGSPTFSWSSSPSGFTSSDSTPTVSPTVTTTYFVAATYSSSVLYDTIVLAVGQALTADFGQSEDTVCSGTSVNFYDSSTSVSFSASYAWTFGTAGSSSDLQNPSQVFSNTTLAQEWLNGNFQCYN